MVNNMALDLSIRDLQKSDHDRWKQLWTAYLRFYETNVSESVYFTAFESLTSKNKFEFQGIVAEQEGEIIGLAHFLFHRNLWSKQDTCYLGDLFVDPLIRGNGVGRRLIEEVSERAKMSNVSGIYWLTQEFNYKGRMLYDQIAKKTQFIVYEKN